METVYVPEEFGCSEKMNLKEYLDDFAQVLEADDNDDTDGDCCSSSMNALMSVFLSKNKPNKSMSRSCENKQNNRNNTPEVVKKRIEVDESPLFNSQINKYNKSPFVVHNQVDNVPSTISTSSRSCSPSSDLKPFSDFIVTIQVFYPFEYQYFNSGSNSSNNFKQSQEIYALGGRNTLAELRDKIACIMDERLFKEVQSCDDDLEELPNPKEKYPSGFFFINNTFYNDLRSEKSVDYSEPIMEWIRQKKIGEEGADFKKARMENVKIGELTFRLGYPYLYQHQVDCEHVIVFTDARLIGNKDDDILHSGCYPYVKKTYCFQKEQLIKCQICKVSTSNWTIIDGDRFPINKMFLCTDCCKSYNFIGTNRLGNFKLYPHF